MLKSSLVLNTLTWVIPDRGTVKKMLFRNNSELGDPPLPSVHLGVNFCSHVVSCNAYGKTEASDLSFRNKR